MNKKLSEKIIRSQAQACKVAIKELLFKVLIEGRPADKMLSVFFRNNRQYGSRDRHLILETTFAVFRWWGWLKKLLPENIKKQLKNKQITEPDAFDITNKNLSTLLHYACILDNLQAIPEELVFCWSSEANLNTPEHRSELAGLQSKISYLKKNNKKTKFSIYDLIPEISLKLFPPDIDLKQLILFFQQRPPMWLRAQTENTLKLLKRLRNYNLDIHLNDKVKNAMYINDPKINLYTLEEFRKGLFEIQDLASQAIGLICNPFPGERWWDACAGAGGKSLQLSSLMQGKGTVVASDIREYKLKDMRKRAKRAAMSNIQCSRWDGKKLKHKKQGQFDGVLVDAPCSCSGTWRRNPDAKWNIASEDIIEISKIQSKILQNAAAGVKEGGTLVYATCSIFEIENQSVVDKFLKDNQNFRKEPFLNPLTGEKTNGMVQILPWQGNCDATFIAKFRKQ